MDIVLQVLSSAPVACQCVIEGVLLTLFLSGE